MASHCMCSVTSCYLSMNCCCLALNVCCLHVTSCFGLWTAGTWHLASSMSLNLFPWWPLFCFLQGNYAHWAMVLSLQLLCCAMAIGGCRCMQGRCALENALCFFVWLHAFVNCQDGGPVHCATFLRS